MNVKCEKCGQVYNDEFRWTICPHRDLGQPAQFLDEVKMSFKAFGRWGFGRQGNGAFVQEVSDGAEEGWKKFKAVRWDYWGFGVWRSSTCFKGVRCRLLRWFFGVSVHYYQAPEWGLKARSFEICLPFLMIHLLWSPNKKA